MNSEDLKEGESRWEGGEAVEQWGGGGNMRVGRHPAGDRGGALKGSGQFTQSSLLMCISNTESER